MTAVAQAACICDNRGSINRITILDDVSLDHLQRDIATPILLILFLVFPE